jgi:hypothetical protein
MLLFSQEAPLRPAALEVELLKLDDIVNRIILAESNGRQIQNERSSAAGPAQFLAGTWLELMREYRPDLTKGRSQAEVLAMRSDAQLARDLTKRSLQQHIALLKRNDLPVTPSTLYLGHFAGSTGAVAVLLAPKSANAALVLASADPSGKTPREKIVAANPFLARFTAGDLQEWAARRMEKRTN